MSGRRIRQVEVMAFRVPRQEAVRSGLNLADPVISGTRVKPRGMRPA